MFQPIELIRKTSDNRLEANPEALEMIRTIQKPIVTISVVGNEEQFRKCNLKWIHVFVSGDSRTGKSFLANYLMGQLNGFPLGAAVEVSNDLLVYTN